MISRVHVYKPYVACQRGNEKYIFYYSLSEEFHNVVFKNATSNKHTTKLK